MQNQIPNNWQKVKLGELADLIPGFAFKSGDFTTDGTPVIKIRNIASGTLTLDNLEYFAGDINSLDKYKINKGDILVSMTGSHVSQWSSVVGKITRNNKDQVFLMNQRVGKIKPNPAKVDNDFLYYILHNDETTLNLANRAGGSANQANISPEIIKSLEISIPELEDQKKIASVISVFDDKIDLNNKIAKTLEEMASEIFKEWFVKSVKSKKLKVKNFKIKDIAYVKTGNRPIKLKEKKEDNFTIPVYGARELMGYTNKSLYNKKIIITGRVGTIGEVYLVDGLSWPSDNALIAYPKDDNYFYLLYFLLKRINYLSLNRGSSQPLIAQSDIENYPIDLPDETKIKEFNIIVSKLFLLKNNKENENQKLAQMRDLLLPKLMKGEIRIQ